MVHCVKPAGAQHSTLTKPAGPLTTHTVWDRGASSGQRGTTRRTRRTCRSCEALWSGLPLRLSAAGCSVTDSQAGNAVLSFYEIILGNVRQNSADSKVILENEMIQKVFKTLQKRHRNLFAARVWVGSLAMCDV